MATYLSIAEAAKILELSKPQARAVLEPDKFVKVHTGGFPRVFFLEKTVHKAKKDRIIAKKAHYESKVANKLKGVIHPGKDYITISEAAALTGLRKKVIKQYCKVKIVYGYKNKNHFFFKREDVIKIEKNAAIRKRNNGGRSSKGICIKCGKKTALYKGANTCLECQGFENKDDPYGIMVKPRKQHRKCPLCGAVLWEGQYMCSNCRKENPLDNVIDPYLAYGEIDL